VRHVFTWARVVAAGLVLVLGLTLAAPPAHAGQATPLRPGTLKSAAETRVARLSASAAAAATQAPAAETSSDKGFFKTTKGAVVLAVFAVGLGYGAYSVSHDRIHSPGRK
jgi:hypothetical protein